LTRRSLISVIVSTYNWPEALRIALESLRAQDDRGFEVVVADDGSAAPTGELVDALAAEFPVPLKHVWRPDKGYRLAAIRNRAIAAAEGEYLVITDGDCFVLPDFVRRHRALAEPGWFVSGKRSYLREGPTHRILARPDRLPAMSRLAWFARSLTNQCTRPFEFVPRPGDAFRRRRPQDWCAAQTCNLGVWRADCLAVNGFDERYAQHGLEDSDFVLRLIRAGVRRKLGDHASIVLHLHHGRRRGPSDAGNGALFAELVGSDRRTAVRGLKEAAGGGE
jgi:glycosyltransferase involved in cell wall biosynthesis